MLLKRLYDSDKKDAKVVGIKVLRANDRQHFSPNILQMGITQGWLKQADSKITIGQGVDAVIYNVVRGPGYYCCHCGKSVDDAASARVHLDAEHAGEESPDKNNPSGYERTHYYDCVKE